LETGTIEGDARAENVVSKNQPVPVDDISSRSPNPAFDLYVFGRLVFEMFLFVDLKVDEIAGDDAKDKTDENPINPGGEHGIVGHDAPPS
jgi:hypothetical protein